MRKALLGYNSFDNSYEQDGYPYGSLKTKRRTWIETKPKHGMRRVDCTLNPKTGRWNKPHAGTYSEVLVLYLEPQPDGREFVECAGLSLHSDDAHINNLRLLVGDDALREYMKHIEDLRKIRDSMNNHYRKPEEKIKTEPLPSFEEIMQAAEVKVA
jgi:hypothetical protein